MSTNSKNPGGSSFITQIIPDILTARPRPGGYVRIDEVQTPVSWKKAKPFTKFETQGEEGGIAADPTKVSLNESSRQHKINTTLNASPWNYLPAKESEQRLEPSALCNARDILAIAISTIMLMAVHHSEIPPEYLQWTYSYLNLIKDEYGHTPPNIQGMLNHIKNIGGSKVTSLITSDAPAAAPAAPPPESSPEPAPPVEEAAPPPAPAPEEPKRESKGSKRSSKSSKSSKE